MIYFLSFNYVFEIAKRILFLVKSLINDTEMLRSYIL
jgi:hypothetical protein